MFERLLPRHLEIIYEINWRFLEVCRSTTRSRGRVNRTSITVLDLQEVVKPRFGDDPARMAALSIIEEHPVKSVRVPCPNNSFS